MKRKVKPKGIVHFLRKVEGKPEWTPPKEKKVYKWPGSCVPNALYDLVVRVCRYHEPGDTFEEFNLVDRALTWNTHELHQEWAAFYDTQVVTEEIYNCCAQWYQSMVEENDWPYETNHADYYFDDEGEELGEIPW